VLYSLQIVDQPDAGNRLSANSRGGELGGYKQFVGMYLQTESPVSCLPDGIQSGFIIIEAVPTRSSLNASPWKSPAGPAVVQRASLRKTNGNRPGSTHVQIERRDSAVKAAPPTPLHWRGGVRLLCPAPLPAVPENTAWRCLNRLAMMRRNTASPLYMSGHQLRTSRFIYALESLGSLIDGYR
jgi:hypothetical protein